MNKSELRDLALLGVRRKIEDLERQIARYHQEFPELFISPTRPAILKAEEKLGGGTWAIPPQGLLAATTRIDQRARKRYVQTPAHKRAIAAANKARAQKSGRTSVTDQVTALLRTHGPAKTVTIQQALRVKAHTTITSALTRLQERGVVRKQGKLWSLKGGRVARKAAANGAWGTRVWHQVHDAISAQGGTARMPDIIKAVGKPSATIISSIDPHMKTGVFKRVGKGMYAVTARPTQETP